MSRGLSNYNSTSEDDDMAENHSKSTPKRCESTKSTVINMKNRKSEERDRKHHLDRRNDRDSLSRFVYKLLLLLLLQTYLFGI